MALNRAIYFGVYSVVKAKAINAGNPESSTVHLVSAIIAGVLLRRVEVLVVHAW